MESGTSAFSLLRYVKGLLANRLDIRLADLSLPVELRGTRLTRPQWQAIVSLAMQLILRELQGQESEPNLQLVTWSAPMVEALCIVLSPASPDYQLPDRAFLDVCFWLSDRRLRQRMRSFLLRHSTPRDSTKAELLLVTMERNLRRWWKALDTTYLDILHDLVSWCDEGLPTTMSTVPSTIIPTGPQSVSLSGSLSRTVLAIYKRVLSVQCSAAYKAWYEQDASFKLSPSFGTVLGSFFHRLEAECNTHSTTPRTSLYTMFVDRTVRDVLIASLGLSSTTRALVRTFAQRPFLCYDETTSRNLQHFLRRARSREPSYISVAVEGLYIVGLLRIHTANSALSPDGARIAFDFMHVLDEIRTGTDNPPLPSLVRLCYLALVMVVGPRTMAGRPDYLGWRILFSRLALALELSITSSLSGRETAEARFLARRCLDQIEQLVATDGDPHGICYYPEDERRWPYHKESVFGDDLVRLLSEVITVHDPCVDADTSDVDVPHCERTTHVPSAGE